MLLITFSFTSPTVIVFALFAAPSDIFDIADVVDLEYNVKTVVIFLLRWDALRG